MDFGTLQLLHRCHREYSRRKLREQSLSDTEYQLCAYIDIHEGCSQEQAAAALRMDKTTVAKALTALERKGWITRAADPIDHRRKQLSLTEEGGVKLAGLTELHSSWLDEIMSVLSPEEQERFEDCCKRLLQAAEALAEKKENEE